LGTFILGLVIGALIGAAGIYVLTRRPAPGPATSVAPEPSLAAPVSSPITEPSPPAPPPPDKPDDDVRQALDASRGLIDELEGRYRDRPAHADDEPDETRPRRRPRPKPKA